MRLSFVVTKTVDSCYECPHSEYNSYQRGHICGLVDYDYPIAARKIYEENVIGGLTNTCPVIEERLKRD